MSPADVTCNWCGRRVPPLSPRWDRDNLGYVRARFLGYHAHCLSQKKAMGLSIIEHTQGDPVQLALQLPGVANAGS